MSAVKATFDALLREMKEKDAEIERLKDLAKRLAMGWDMEVHVEFGRELSFGGTEWHHWDMVQDPEVRALFEKYDN